MDSRQAITHQILPQKNSNSPDEDAFESRLSAEQIVNILENTAKHIHLQGIPGLKGEVFLERHSQMILSTRKIVELIEAA